MQESRKTKILPDGTEVECPPGDETLECAEDLSGIAIVISEDEFEDKETLRGFLDDLARRCDGRVVDEKDLVRHNSNIRVHCPRAMAWRPSE
jgi:hypothetical protein